MIEFAKKIVIRKKGLAYKQDSDYQMNKFGNASNLYSFIKKKIFE